MANNLGHLSGRKGLENNLFEKLVQESKKEGTVKEGDIAALAEEFLFGEANVLGSISFYDFLKKENREKKVYVCNGTACMTSGTQGEVNKKLSSYFKEEEIGSMCCLGRCHENSAFHFLGNNYSGDNINSLDTIISTKATSKDNYNVSHNLREPILIADIGDIKAFYASFKEKIHKSQNLLEEIKKSGIRGRGGAGFPIGIKLESLKNEVSDKKFIVCNADEGDPGAYSDRYLLEKRPHAVLQGMLIAGLVSGAEYGVLYIRAEYPEAVAVIKKAIRSLEEAGLCGKAIAGTSFNFYFKVIEGAGAYICGEETALLSSIEGQRPEVRVRPPFPTQQGLFNKPTAVNNVETLAFLPSILKRGGDYFAALGTPNSTGTKLMSLDSFFNNPGVYEVEMGTPLTEVVNILGGGFKEPVKALHIGGPLGGIIPVDKIDSLTVDFESFNEGGFLLGHGSIVCIPETFPMINYLEHLFHFTAEESCGKCFPCSIGSRRGMEMLQRALDRDFKIDRVLFDDLLETLESGSLCGLGGGLPLGVKNALEYFSEELSLYFTAK